MQPSKEMGCSCPAHRRVGRKNQSRRANLSQDLLNLSFFNIFPTLEHAVWCVPTGPVGAHSW
ncbi:hypothetical protein BURKHO8Y_20016 [Burkholderia sp. 8Y]|nr:hypothetical protein BURKHO8Y_20016 [Burkholderia sp. 8Y]